MVGVNVSYILAFPLSIGFLVNILNEFPSNIDDENTIL